MVAAFAVAPRVSAQQVVRIMMLTSNQALKVRVLGHDAGFSR